jgi:hypothetical protein
MTALGENETKLTASSLELHLMDKKSCIFEKM